ncbi:hypothetical protein [Yoonia sp. 208BN28-4]|uniref:hypothetical protein n=1 Tax=Yoonia sp. 208BN28-4 TaxID=3126505 RepID=UPI0030B04F66
MTSPIKALVAIAAVTALANCGGTRDLSDLPVREGPQAISPVTFAAPDAGVVVVTENSDVVAIDG